MAETVEERKARMLAAQGKAAEKIDTQIIPQYWEDNHYSKEFETEEEFKRYKVITNGKTIPSQLKYTRMAFDYLSTYKEETHQTASLVGALYAAVLIGTGRVWTYSGAPVSMFIGFIGKTGSAKDPVLKALKRLDYEDVQEGTICKNGSKVMSAPAIDTLLRSEGTNSLVLLLDELGDNIREILSGKSTKAGLKPVLKEAYSINAGDTYEGGYYSDQGGKQKTVVPETITSLSLGMLGVSTKDQLLRSMDATHLGDGFINRWVFIDGVLHTGSHNLEFSADIPIPLQDHLSTFQARDGAIKKIPLDKEARDYYSTSIGQVSRNMGLIYQWAKDEEFKIEISSRVRENALRLSTAIAHFEHMDSVPLWLLEWCFDFVFEGVKHFYYIFNNQASKAEKEWNSLIEKCKTWLSKKVGETLTKRDLKNMSGYRNVSHNVSQKNHIVSYLIEMELLVQKKDGSYLVKSETK